LEAYIAKGFKAPKMPGGSMGMMGQIQKLQEQIEQVQAQLAEETVSAAAGGGSDGDITGDSAATLCRSIQGVKRCRLDMLRDLIVVAFNSAWKSREMAAERLGPLAGGLPF
jgi:DNA-binding protein YbaB